MEQPDALVTQCRNVARMPDGPDKESLKAIALEILARYEAEGGITAELRVMLEKLLRGESSQ